MLLVETICLAKVDWGVNQKMAAKKPAGKKRKSDPYLDRRSGEDRREVYDADYFENGGQERRKEKDRRKSGERRDDCVRVSDWTSVCPDDDEEEKG
jgi:hypothetical protein